MGLPKIEHPLFITQIPSSGKTVRFRPFLVKEEKILLLALTGEDEKEMTLAAKQIVNNCVVDLDEDVDKMPIFDIEWLFIQIRIKSVGSKCRINFTPNKNFSGDCEKCKNGISEEINLENVVCEKHENHTNKIFLTDSIGIVMKYPTPDILNVKTDNISDLLYKSLAKCIEYVFDGDKIYNTEDFTENELQDFLDSLNRDQADKIKTFFDTMPSCVYDVHIKCDCGKIDEMYRLSGLSDFFS